MYVYCIVMLYAVHVYMCAYICIHARMYTIHVLVGLLSCCIEMMVEL